MEDREQKTEYTRQEIKNRIKTLKENGAGKKHLPARLSYEFGVPLNNYSGVRTEERLIETTFNDQTSPSPLEIETEAELNYYLSLAS